MLKLGRVDGSDHIPWSVTTAKAPAALKMKTKLDLNEEYLFNTHSHRHKNTLREALLNEK